MSDSVPPIPRLTYLRIKNYRALRDVLYYLHERHPKTFAKITA